jgi:hypothetical protein
MSTTQINEVVGIVGGVAIVALYAGLILRPAWGAYSRLWERMAAAVLSFYVLAVLVGAGVFSAAAIVRYWI